MTTMTGGESRRAGKTGPGMTAETGPGVGDHTEHTEGMIGNPRPIRSVHGQWTLAGYDKKGFACLDEQCPACTAQALIINEEDAAECLACSWRETGHLPPVTDELLAALEFRYADPRVCRVCGAPLQVADTRDMKMACTSDAASPLKSRHEAAGVTWKQALDHYQDSVLYNPPAGDTGVIALVAEIRSLRTSKDEEAGAAGDLDS